MGKYGRWAVIVSFAETALAAYILIEGIYILLTCLSVSEADAIYGGLVDFAVYKENAFIYFVIGLMIMFAGTSLWISGKLFWVMTRTFLITTFLSLALLMGITGASFFGMDWGRFFICLSIIAVFYIVFRFIDKKLNKNDLQIKMGITSKHRAITWICGIGCTVFLHYLLLLILHLYP